MIASTQRRVSKAMLAASPMPMQMAGQGCDDIGERAEAAGDGRDERQVGGRQDEQRQPSARSKRARRLGTRRPNSPLTRPAVERHLLAITETNVHNAGISSETLPSADRRAGAAASRRPTRVDKAPALGPCSFAENGDLEGELMSFAEYTDAIKAFVTLHREWAAPIVFVLAFGESLAFVSLILPFWGMLVVIGTIIGASDSLSFWGIMTAAGRGGRARRLAVLLAGLPLPRADPAHVAAQPLSQPHPAGPQVLHPMGRLGHRDSAASPAPCVPACRSSPASPRCPRCASRSPTGARRSCGRSCCFPRAVSA